ncbi:TonB-dependent receptor [Emcibacter sp.]|uniref:TonB-dependent receptor n=1 Tax=Emcibacter sp. TaxID=1979954 RepID=UPI002AA7BCC5|nr:TonB-dependent receptor [Emcibacter sp.]
MAVIGTILPPAMQAIAQGQDKEENVLMLEEITVTARRREENLQDIPIAVTALTSDALERQQIFETTDLDNVAPNLQFTSYGPLSGNNSAAQVFIRGIGQTDPTGAVDPGVGIYIDDVYMGRSVGGAMDFKDISSVQILRGPQGTLFGRNTIGGAVLISTNLPGDELGGTVRARTGTDNLRELFGAFDLPVSDTLGTRFSMGMRQRDGYVTRQSDGVDLGDDDSYSLNGTVRWEPSDSFSLTIRGDYSSEDENGSPFVFKNINENAAFVAATSVGAGCPGATFPPPAVPVDVVNPACGNDATYDLGPFTNGGTAKVFSSTENWGFSGTAEYDFNDSLTLKSVTSYRELAWSGARDADNTALPILSTEYDSTSEQFSQELQALYSSDKLNGVVGLYYFDEDTHDEVRVPVALPIPNILGGGDGSRDHQSVDLSTESWAAFTEWTYDITDKLSLSGGLRYTDETKGMTLIAFNIEDVHAPEPTTLPTTVPPLFVDPSPHELGFSAVTGTAKLQYRWNDSLMTYASWSQGFKSGGFNQRYNAPPPNNQPITFDEEKAQNYEVGFKADVADNLRLNGAVFHTDYTDMQLIYRLGVVPLLFNAGSASIEGFELEMTWNPTGRLLVEGSVGYLDSSIDEVVEIVVPDQTVTATVDKGNRLPFSPEWKANLGVSYFFDIGHGLELTPRVDVVYTSEMYYDAANSEGVLQDDYTLVNASLQLESPDSGWRVTFGVNNLTDKLYQVAGNSSFSTATGYEEVIYARKRNWYLALTADF